MVSKEELRQARSFFDFINVELYETEGRFSVKDMDYWFWNGDELQKHHTTEALKYDDIKKYVENGQIYIQ